MVVCFCHNNHYSFTITINTELDQYLTHTVYRYILYTSRFSRTTSVYHSVDGLVYLVSSLAFKSEFKELFIYCQVIPFKSNVLDFVFIVLITCFLETFSFISVAWLTSQITKYCPTGLYKEVRPISTSPVLYGVDQVGKQSNRGNKWSD